MDFDWFTEQTLGDPLGLARRFQEEGVACRVDSTEPGTLHGRVAGVRVSFIEYRYPSLEAPRRFPGLPTPLASISDIACMKLSAITQRGARKDFVDLHAIGQTLPLVEMIELYRRKFGVRDIGHVLTALTYFDDADRERAPQMLHRIDWTSVKVTLRGWVKGIAGPAG